MRGQSPPKEKITEIISFGRIFDSESEFLKHGFKTLEYSMTFKEVFRKSQFHHGTSMSPGNEYIHMEKFYLLLK